MFRGLVRREGRAAGPGDIARGKYVFGAAAGCGCPAEPKGPPNAGGKKFEGPFGAEEELRALVAFLRTVQPVRRANTPKKIAVPMFERVVLPIWLATFAAKETPPAAAPASDLARGEYLVRAVGHCGECHTPRSALTMAVDNSRLLAGNPKKTGPEGQMAPNITPDKATGIGEWSEEQIATYLATGTRPDGDVAGGLMGDNIQGTPAGYKDLTRADLRAITRYLKRIPAIRNKVD